MKTSTALLMVLFLGTSSANALAAATPEEAQRLTAVLQAYLGAEPGVVTVAPAGDSYAVKLDPAPLFAKVNEPGLSATVTPFELTLSDQGGGKWKVDQDQALSLQFKIEGAVDMKGSIGSLKGTGVFDEALGAFATSSADMTQLGFEQVVTEKGQTSKVNYTLATLHSESAMAAGTDGADGTSTYSFTDLHETISTPGAPDGSMPPMDVSVAAPSGSQDATMKGLKTHGLIGLLAWFVAHPSPDAIKADQADLKDKLRAALPLFQSMEGNATVASMTVNTMVGSFAIDKLDFIVSANGIVEAGALREKISVAGLKLPAGIVPPWATGLAPSNFTIDFNVADFNLAAPAALAIDNFDFNQEPPLKPEMQAQLMQALMPKGTVTVGLGPSEIVASVFDLKAEGSMTAGPVAMPAGQATIMLKGLDAVMTALQSAPPEMGMQQMAPMVIVAKGMAKAEADGTLTWNIESTPQGGVLVNGVDVTKMGGQ